MFTVEKTSRCGATDVFTLIQRLPLSAMTSTLAAGRCAPLRRCSAAGPSKGMDLKMASTGAGAQRTSFHTAIRYGALVDNGGRQAQDGLSRNY